MSKWIILIKIDDQQNRVDRVEHNGWSGDETVKLLKQAEKVVEKEKRIDIPPTFI